MEQYKKDFIDFMVQSQVLKFGSFTLKSGRKSPFYMNAGSYITGSQLSRLGEYYAQAIHENFGDDFDVLFGPAYKGIPLSVATVIAYNKLYGKEIRYCSNRKEAKDHGADKGLLLGSELKDGDRVVIMEQGKVKIVGEIVSLNRMEKALDTNKGALDVITEKYGFPAIAIVTMKDVVEHLSGSVITDELKKEIDAYYAEWGAE